MMLLRSAALVAKKLLVGDKKKNSLTLSNKNVS